MIWRILRSLVPHFLADVAFFPRQMYEIRLAAEFREARFPNESLWFQYLQRRGNSIFYQGILRIFEISTRRCEIKSTTMRFIQSIYHWKKFLSDIHCTLKVIKIDIFVKSLIVLMNIKYSFSIHAQHSVAPLNYLIKYMWDVKIFYYDDFEGKCLQ